MAVVLFGLGCGRTDFSVPVASGSASAGSSSSGGNTDDATDTTPTTIADSTLPTTPTTGDPPPPPLDCTIDQECDTPDPCAIGMCVGGTCTEVPRDLDEDGFPPLSCGGTDCNDLNPNTFPGAPENCFDADDNDCNGVADCFDPVCEDVPDCGCQPSPGGEQCDNLEDDDCDTTVDCNDPDCLGTPACGCAMAEGGLCVNGFDDDCDGAIDCNDPDCLSDPACVCMAQTEQCDDGTDDDCDLLVDCADPDCDGLFPCTCLGPPIPEICGDGIDNDCDSDVDCADTDCLLSSECDMCLPEQCNNMADDDCDGLIDCADDACLFDPACAPAAEICNNDLDDDFDGLFDCEDPDCAGVPICAESQSNCETAAPVFESGTFFGDTTGNPNGTEGSCGGGAGEAVFNLVLTEPSLVTLTSIGTGFDSVLYVRRGSCTVGQEIACDDDSGGMWAASIEFTLLSPGSYYVFLDGYTIDPLGGANEGPWQFNVEIVPNPPEICDDIIDNDGDIYADCGDPDCVTAPNCAGCVGGADPTAEFGTARCTDGIDNDCDGTIDCEDEDCSASDFYVTECCNGFDDNGNSIPDDFNCRCNNDSECDDGQICYDHTSNTCGFPCTAFFGNICPFVAAGSICNDATVQCEF